MCQRTDIYKKAARLVISEQELRTLDYPRSRPNGKEGTVTLYGDHFGFKRGMCKRCDKPFDTTFKTRKPCDFHLQNSRRYKGRWHPHMCCGKNHGSTGCQSAPSHVHKANLYLDGEGFVTTKPKKETPEDGDYGVYAIDTESIHTMKGLEVCKVTVVDRNLKVVYDEYCLPTTEIIDYNTVWSGITEKHLKGVTKTFEEMRDDILELVSKDTLLVGHGLASDMMVLKILHDKVIDTLILYPHDRGLPLKRSLKDITKSVLYRDIQTGARGHDSKEDAEVAMKLLLRKL